MVLKILRSSFAESTIGTRFYDVYSCRLLSQNIVATGPIDSLLRFRDVMQSYCTQLISLYLHL